MILRVSLVARSLQTSATETGKVHAFQIRYDGLLLYRCVELGRRDWGLSREIPYHCMPCFAVLGGQCQAKLLLLYRLTRASSLSKLARPSSRHTTGHLSRMNASFSTERWKSRSGPCCGAGGGGQATMIDAMAKWAVLISTSTAHRKPSRPL